MNANSLSAALQARQHERQSLLDACQTVLRKDQRIQAAWLFGSSSRNESDSLSDLDLWTVVDDDAIGELMSKRRHYVEQLGPFLLCLESPRNAPAGGAYLMALYFGAYGPQQIDWYWQPASASCLPKDGLLLFERQPLERKTDLSTLDLVGNDQDAPDSVQQRATFFWAMSFICAKKIARHDHESAYQILAMLILALQDCQKLLGQASYPQQGEAVPAFDSDAQLRLLSALVAQMEACNAQIFAEDDPIQTSIAEQFRAFLALCQALSITPKRLS